MGAERGQRSSVRFSLSWYLRASVESRPLAAARTAARSLAICVTPTAGVARAVLVVARRGRGRDRRLIPPARVFRRLHGLALPLARRGKNYDLDLGPP